MLAADRGCAGLSCRRASVAERGCSVVPNRLSLNEKPIIPAVGPRQGRPVPPILPPLHDDKIGFSIRPLISSTFFWGQLLLSPT
jgi:hypothetical protein